MPRFRLVDSPGDSNMNLSHRASNEEQLNQRVAEAIVQLIEDQDVRPGDRLPSERALADHFLVSRTTIREGISALKLCGIVEVRGGSGIYVCGRQLSPLLRGLTPDPLEVLGARLVLEPEVASIAASRARRFHLSQVSDAIDAMDHSMRNSQAVDALDRQFHVAVAEGTGNPVLVRLISDLWDKLRGTTRYVLDGEAGALVNHTNNLGDHRRILEALRVRDAEGSRKAMRMHIARVMRRVQKTLG